MHLPDGLWRTFTAATTPTPTEDIRLCAFPARSASKIANGGDGVEQQPLHFRTRVGLVLLSAAGCCWFFVLAKRQDDDSSDEEEGGEEAAAEAAAGEKQQEVQVAVAVEVPEPAAGDNP